MIFLITIAALFYYTIVYVYSTEIFDVKSKFIQVVLFVILFNVLPVVILYHYHLIGLNSTIIYSIGITIQFIILYKVSLDKAIFGCLSFAVNFFAIRQILIGIFSLNQGVDLNAIYDSPEYISIILLLNYSIPIPYILTVRTYFPPKLINKFLRNKINLIYSNIILASTLLYQTIFLEHISPTLNASDLSANSIKVGLLSIGVFVIVLVCIYQFSELKEKSSHYYNLNKVTNLNYENNQIINQNGKYDSLTNFYTCDAFIKYIDERILKNEKFYLFTFYLLDYQSISITNNIKEADKYLVNITSIIEKHFNSEVIGRMNSSKIIICGSTINQDKIKNTVDEFIKEINYQNKDKINHNLTFITSGTEVTAKKLLDRIENAYFS